MAKIRQEINISDSLVLSGTVGVNANEKFSIDPAQFNGTVSYYLEIVAINTSVGDETVAINGWTGGTAVTIPALTLTPTLIRSVAQAAPVANTDYNINISATPLAGDVQVKSARIVIIQDATTLTNTETQIELGNASTTTTTTYVALTNPKYWFYENGNWDGTLTVYFEGTFMSGTSKSAAALVLQVSDSSSIAAPSWSDVASAEITTTGTVATRVRSSAITLTADRWYRVAMKAGNSKSGITVYNAKVIIDQTNRPINQSAVNTTNPIYGGTGGSGEANQASAQAFIYASSSFTLGAIGIRVSKVSSPTDNIYIEIRDTLTGTLLDTSANVAASGLPTDENTVTTFYFSGGITISASTTYYALLYRTGARDTTNHTKWWRNNVGIQTLGGSWIKGNGTWGTIGDDHDIRVYGLVTKVEPQYLLANTLLAAGTALQTFLTEFDSTEWDDGAGTTTYYFQGEAANGSTSDMTLQEADGGGAVTNSTLTNIDNAQISAAMTMPTDQNLDIIANANAGDVAAARILVAYVFSAAVADSIALTGTVTDDTEADIVTGGSTIILTITGDTWIAAGTGPIGSTANTQALIDGLVSAQSEANGWNNVVQPGIETSDVVRTSDTVATITLDAEATYNITANETITATVPAEVLTGAVQIVASPTFTITAVATYRRRLIFGSAVGVASIFLSLFNFWPTRIEKPPIEPPIIQQPEVGKQIYQIEEDVFGGVPEDIASGERRLRTQIR